MNNQSGQQGWSSPSHSNWQQPGSLLGQSSHGGVQGMHQISQLSSPGGSWSTRGKQ